MDELLAAATAAQQVCHDNGWGCCVVGGLAVLRWGRPRPTKDVDLLVETGYGDWAAASELLFDRFEPRFADSRQFAVDSRVVQFWAPNGTAVDVALGTSRRLHRIMQRATAWQVGSVAVRTFSAEDLIVHKALCGRESDWRDVAGIISRRGDTLDRDLVLREFRPMLQHRGFHLGDPLQRLQRQASQQAADRLQRLLTGEDR
ncbi:hypothetical protein ACN27F_06730 [Solwaraspora sp. WMMB335]|uniref:hypothetical protein n=1 Tax=Solwaraspora sp. WMMB335 TaxID=3404118 RepID=UPI003B95744C